MEIQDGLSVTHGRSVSEEKKGRALPRIVFFPGAFNAIRNIRKYQKISHSRKYFNRANISLENMFGQRNLSIGENIVTEPICQFDKISNRENITMEKYVEIWRNMEKI